MLDDERFTAYIKKTGMMDGFAQLTLYVTAVCVTAVSLSLSFELASLAFPGDIGRGVASLYKGMIKYIETKAQQVKEVAQEVAVGTAITVATGGAAAAAAVTKHMADRNERERERDHIADVDKDLKDKAEEGASQQAQDTSSTHFKTRDEMEREYRERQMQAEEKDDWVLAAEKADLEAKAQAELEKQMGGPDSPTVKLSHMAEAAYSWADRLAYLRAFASTHKYCAEDIMADIRDAHKVAEAETKGIKDEFLQMREERLKENMFLMDMVQKQGLNTNSRFTFKERMAVKFFGEAKGAWLSLTWRQKLAKALLSEAKAEKYLRGSIYSKQMHGTPRLTSWGALFGRDTLSSPKQDREMLKRLGIYKDVMRAEMLRRMANSFIRPSVRPKVKFLGITIRKEKPVFRNWLHKKLYKSCMKNLATTEALIALRCREILADRDVHINGMGKAIFLPNADLYWRRDIDFEAMREAQQKRGATEFNNQQAQWFYDRYGSLEEARKMQMELEVFDTIRRVNDADDFIVERQLKALDETEIRLWKDINENYHSYRRVKENIEKIILSYDRNS